MNAQLKTKIWEYLNSFDDIEPLDIYEMTDLFAKANRLLVEVLEDDNHPEDVVVCSMTREDIKQAGFDPSGLSDEDMHRIASKQGDLMLDCCDYWTGLQGSCEYWEVPRLEDDEEDLEDVRLTESQAKELGYK